MKSEMGTVPDKPGFSVEKRYNLNICNRITEDEVEGRLTISEMAKIVGVSPKTLIRWEKAGKIRKAKRDWKGWRVFLEEDITHIQNLVSTVYEPL